MAPEAPEVVAGGYGAGTGRSAGAMASRPVNDVGWMAVLRCAECQGQLAPELIATPEGGRGAWGTLVCQCSRYPLIDDIPILLHDRVPINSIGENSVIDEGPEVDELVRLVTGPDPLDALVRLVAVPPVPWPLSRFGAARTIVGAAPASRVRTWVGSRQLRTRLARRDTLTVEDWLASFYLYGATLDDAYSYFMYRYSQPRQLAFLAMLQALPPGTVFDIGCGLGHLTWQLSIEGRDVIGLDYNFAQVWVARWWMGEGARFVCANAATTLPFASDSAAATIFVDGIHLMPHVEVLVDEMRRCAKGGTVFLPRFGNAAIPPPEGTERTVSGWRALLERRGEYRMKCETTLIDAYLDGRAADLRADDSDEHLTHCKWLYAILSENDNIFTDYGLLPDPPPHARGRLTINPIYTSVGRDNRRFRLTFPSDWYAFENGALTRFHDYQAVLTSQQMAELRTGKITPQLRPLIDRFVVIGVPERYIRSLRRRYAPRVYQMATALLPQLVKVPDATALPPDPDESDEPNSDHQLSVVTEQD
jgi:SAM-dependent methyltransferase